MSPVRFDPRLYRLRRFEAQLHYNAAYTFWNLRGVLAEKWAHGPLLGAYNETKNELQLTVESGKRSPLLAASGLKRSAFVAEQEYADEGMDLATRWFEDCLSVLTPRVVNRIVVRHFYAYPTDDPTRVSAALARDYPGLADVIPSEYSEQHLGVQFQGSNEVDGTTTRSSAIFGVYGPHQEAELFNVLDGSWHLGFHHFWDVSEEGRFEDPLVTVMDVMERAAEEARSLSRRYIAKAMSHD